MTMTSAIHALLLGPLAFLALPIVTHPTPASCTEDACEVTADRALQACRRAAQAEFWRARAMCGNLATVAERTACASEAFDALDEAFDLCDDQHDARLEACDRLGDGIYNPVINPANFTTVINNPYMPRIPGTKFIYEKVTAAGLEHSELFVTHDTKVILGVTCRTLEDTNALNGEVIEHTFDWVAQDISGNVWYFGELSMDVEDGLVVGLGGSWQAGVNGAKPGILMKAAPHVGNVYRQEFAIEEAEDIAAVLHLSTPAVVPFGSFPNCLKTEDFTPLSPNALEHKFYASGVGTVLEVNVVTGVRSQLIAIQHL
jgi:hypothetical protein